MSKNISILEGGVSRTFNNVDKINLRESGTSNLISFVPQDEAADYADLIDKTVTKNGTYIAANENVDGYKSVTVNVAGALTYTVSFIVDGSVFATYSVEDGVGISQPPAFDADAEGYAFSGWYTSSSGGTAISFPYYPSADTSIYAHVTALEYGVSFEGAANTGATVSRTGAAEDKVARVGTNLQNVANDFDGIYPWSKIRRCCGNWVNGEFVVNAYEGRSGYATDGTNGEIYVEIPLFYYKATGDASGAVSVSICRQAKNGYSPSPAHVGKNGTIYNKTYIAAYPMSVVDNKPTSRSGVFVAQASLNDTMVSARKAGAGFSCYRYAEHLTLVYLMIVEFASRDIQYWMRGAYNLRYDGNDVATQATSGNTIVIADASNFVVGQTISIGESLGYQEIATNRIVTAISGNTITFGGEAVTVPVGSHVFSVPWKTGACDGVLSSSGSYVSNTDGRYPCVYRGVENPYAGFGTWFADLLIEIDSDNYRQLYYLPEAAKYANGERTSDYVKIGRVPDDDGIVQVLSPLNNAYADIVIPVTVWNGSGTEYYASVYYKSADGDVVTGVLMGNRGSHSGPVKWQCWHTGSFSLWSTSRLSYQR